MGRSPCCEKLGLKKGPWTPEEDQKLLAYIEEYGHGSWRTLPSKAGLQRCGKSCRLRWTNYLRPDIKRGKFSLQEEQTIIQLHALLGNRWSAIATHLSKRTDNEIKNYWNTHLKKRLTKMGIDPVTHKPKSNALGAGQSKDAANLSHMAQWESARLEAEARLVRESKLQLPNPYPPPAPASQLLLLNKPAAPTPPPPPPVPPCLDVLKAWQGAWSRPIKQISIPGRIFTSAGSLESPTSTLNFAENSTISLPNVGIFSDGDCLSSAGMVNYGDSSVDASQFSHDTSFLTDATYVADSLRLPNIMEGLTDILLDNVDGQNITGSCSGDFEENKNYWNSILNLVNSPPSGSPVF